MTAMKHYTTMLTIAGSDPSGGAGIQADIKTATALGVYAMSVITAVTAQNTTGVAGFEAVSPAMLEAQLRCVLSDVRPDAVKIGMIPSAEHVAIIAALLREYEVGNVVLDPVLVATSGDSLSDGGTVAALLSELAPLAAVITPNLPEIEVLTGEKPASPAEMGRLAGKLRESTGAGAVLLKGGHISGDADIIDVYADAENTDFIMHSRINTPNTHGTGCTLSSAIASNLAKGYDLDESVERAKEYISGALAAMLDLGHGSGPMNHMFALKGAFTE